MLGQVEIDLVTCYLGEPRGFAGRVYRIHDYGGPAGREKLRAELAARDYSVVGIICAAEPIMTKWKWALVARLPAKVFILNENGDYLWVDRGHWAVIRDFALFRAGLAGAGAVRTLMRLALSPITLLFLLSYAATVHLTRRRAKVGD